MMEGIMDRRLVALVANEIIKIAKSITAEDKDRATMIDEIVDAVEQSKRNMVTSVERKETKGSDGKWYGAQVPPRNVTKTDEKRSYWVSMSSDGTTHGNRYKTKQEWEAEMEKRVKADGDSMRKEMEKLDDEKLMSQYKYWVLG